MPPPRALVVIIPGNPGDPAFYAEFADHLRADGHEVLVSYHPSTLPAAGHSQGLRAHAEHHAANVRRHLVEGQRRLVLVGHSVGAYLAYLMVAHGLLPVQRVFMLFPFLARPRWTGRLLLWALGVRGLVALVFSTFRALPRRLQRWCLARFGAGIQAPTVLRMIASPSQVENAVAMAALERAEIVPRPDAGYLFEHALFRDADRFRAVVSAGDPWATPRAMAPLGELAYRFPPPIGHSFVVDADQTRRVAELLHRFLAAPPTAAGRPDVAGSGSS